MEIAALASTGLAFFIVAVSPGPATLSNATIAMAEGRATSLKYGAGLSCGLVFWGLIAATGMGAVLQGSLYLLPILKIAGGVYLLWLAVQSARSVWVSTPEKASVEDSKRWFLRGLLLNMSNPKSVIAWMAALSIGLDANTDVWSVATATLVCIAVGFITNALYSFVFSIGGMMRGYQRLRRRINAVVAGLFAFAGLGMIRSAFVQ
ncbi:MAG: LysE family translocator [Granulosicoccus sp.]